MTKDKGVPSEYEPLLRTLPSLDSDQELPSVDTIAGKAVWGTLALAAGTAYGYNVSIASMLPYMQSEMNWTTGESEFASAAATLTDAISMICGGYLADYFGRKVLARVAGFAHVIGSLGGSGKWIDIAGCSADLSENTPPDSRGILVAMFQIGVSVGILLPYSIMVAFENWRWSGGLGAIPGLCILLLFYGVFPESLNWVDSRNTSRGQRVTRLENEVTQRNSQMKSWLYLSLGILLAYANKSIDPILFYGPTLLMATGESRRESNIVGLICNSFSLLGTLLAVILMSSKTMASRRPLYLFLFGFVVIAYLGAAVLVYMAETSTNVLVPVFGLLILAYQSGPGSLGLVILNELFDDPRSRGRLSSVCTFCISGFALLLNGTMLSYFEYFGEANGYALYGLSYLILWCVFYCCLPETKDRRIGTMVS